MLWKTVAIAVLLVAHSADSPAADVVSENQRPVPNSTRYEGKPAKYYLNGLSVHTYETTEGHGNWSIIFENDTNLVLLEPQSMPTSARDLQRYIRSLGKPLVGVLISYHGVGPDSFPGTPIYATPEAIEFIKSGKAEDALQNFARNVPGADPKIIIPTNPLTSPEFEIGGIKFELHPEDLSSRAGPGVDVGFPANCLSLPEYKMYYMHMLCAHKHLKLGSLDEVEPYIEYLEDLKQEGYEIFLCAHHRPETVADLNTRINYLRKIQMVAKVANTPDEFILEVKRSFPTMQGEEYLKATAANLYKDMPE